VIIRCFNGLLKAAKILQLEEYLDRKPGQLSGGQRQRVAIGRAIVKEPRVFLFDEPLSNLDAALRVQMRIELDNLHSTLGTTMIYVTHDQVEAMTLADRIVVLNQGRTEQIGSPLELYHRPQTKFVAGFIGSPQMNFLQVDFQDFDGDSLIVSYEDTTVTCKGFAELSLNDDNTNLIFGIRPEHLTVCKANTGNLNATVKIIEAFGNETIIYTELLNKEQIVVRAQSDIVVNKGETIGLKIKTGNEHFFTISGRALPRTQHEMKHNN